MILLEQVDKGLLLAGAEWYDWNKLIRAYSYTLTQVLSQTIQAKDISMMNLCRQ